jgi:hypothetical protein
MVDTMVPSARLYLVMGPRRPKTEKKTSKFEKKILRVIFDF